MKAGDGGCREFQSWGQSANKVTIHNPMSLLFPELSDLCLSCLGPVSPVPSLVLNFPDLLGRDRYPGLDHTPLLQAVEPVTHEHGVAA